MSNSSQTPNTPGAPMTGAQLAAMLGGGVEQEVVHYDPDTGDSRVVERADTVRSKPNAIFNTAKPADKGAAVMTFNGTRADWQKRLIQEQVAWVTTSKTKGICGEAFTAQDVAWSGIVFHHFSLPSLWKRVNPNQLTTDLMIIFPDQYPELPPVGFYLPRRLQVPPEAAHLFEGGVEGRYGVPADLLQNLAGKGWVWFCSHVRVGKWNPAPIQRVSNWRNGDNLASLISNASVVLTDPR